jgi:hypothetical protein
VRDYFNITPGRVFSSVKKGLYRKRVSSGPSEGPSLGPSGDPSLGPSLGSKGVFPTWFIGKYVREAVRLIKEEIITGELVEGIEGRWRRLLKTFPHYTNIRIAYRRFGYRYSR